MNGGAVYLKQADMPLHEQPPPGTTPAGMVVTLDQLTGGDRNWAGSKAANLGEMIRAGLPVPGGFCITTQAYREWFKGQSRADVWLSQLERLDLGQPEEIRETAAELRQQLGSVPLPEPVEAALVKAWERHGSGRAWAVRSSATAEDLPDASFAGQQDTVLNVRGREALLDAVRRCWISLFTDRAVFYRMKNSIAHRATAMGVVVQEMVPAEAAGVLFTADPVTGETGRFVIEAIYGLGEALVLGRVSPDRLVLDQRTLRVIGRHVNPKAVEIVPEEAGGVRECAVAVPRRGEPCLSDAMARRLAKLGRRAERLFGRPQDVEWAVRGGQVFLLQSRPITALPASKAQVPDIWTNANAIEAIPDVATPMTWSVMERLLEDFLHPLAKRVGLNVNGRPLIGIIAGRVYINVSSVIELSRNLSGPVTADFATTFGGQYAGLEEVLKAESLRGRPRLGVGRLARLARLAGWLLPHLHHQDRLIVEWHQRVQGDLPRTDPARLSDEELANHPRALLRLACRDAGEGTWAAAVLMGIAALLGSTAVFRLSRRWLDDADGSIANRLISGAGDMNSAENGLALWRLAAWVRKHPTLVQALLEPAAFSAMARTLADLPLGRELLERWQAFMAQHGHQARGGMDVHNPRWSEMPDYVLGILRVYLRIGDDADPLVLQAQRLRARHELLTDCRRRLGNPLKRWLFAFLVRISQRGLAQRENVKNGGVRMVAILRRALQEAGRRLVERGILRERDEVFFLRLEELESVLGGDAALDVRGAIAARQAEHARNQALTPPPVVVGRYDPDRSVPMAIDEQARVLRGLAVSPGLVRGKARVILHADATERVLPGEILVAPYTDPGWTPYFLPAAAIVVDVGGQLSHGSVVAREYGIPAVVNVGPATRIIKTGQLLQVDGRAGVVTILT